MDDGGLKHKVTLYQLHCWYPELSYPSTWWTSRRWRQASSDISSPLEFIRRWRPSKHWDHELLYTSVTWLRKRGEMDKWKEAFPITEGRWKRNRFLCSSVAAPAVADENRPSRNIHLAHHVAMPQLNGSPVSPLLHLNPVETIWPGTSLCNFTEWGWWSSFTGPHWWWKRKMERKRQDEAPFCSGRLPETGHRLMGLWGAWVLTHVSR